jgi:HEPN domain-containing protein
MKKKPIAEGRRWFQQGEYELRVAYNLAENQFYAATCFFAHQAAEKFLKALLYAQGVRRVVGHSISDLCDNCAEHFAAFVELKGRIRQLDLYYIPTRYPNGIPGGIPAEMYDETDSTAALNMVADVRTAVTDAVPDLAQTTENGAYGEHVESNSN